MTKTKVICKLTPELNAKRTKRTGLQIEHFQPRPPERGLNLSDCAIRSACWATGEDWESVYKEMREETILYQPRHQDILKSGTPLAVLQRFYRKRGWTWVEAPNPWSNMVLKSTSGRTSRGNVLFKAENLPKQLCVAITTTHAVAVEDHVCLDSYDSRGDRSCILEGYFIKKS